jgi:hypothetical protein
MNPLKQHKSNRATSPKSQRKSKRQLQITTVLSVITLVCESNLENDVLKPPLGYARNRDVKALFDWADSVSTVVYDTAAQHFAAHQLAALVLKFPWPRELLQREDPREVAIKKFHAAEERCRKTNYRLTKRSPYDKYISYAAQWIEKVIGSEPDLDSIYAKCFFSSGANIGVHGNATNLFRKLEAGWSVSPTAVPHLRKALLENFQIFEHMCPKRGQYRCYDTDLAVSAVQQKLVGTHYNKVSFVPKNAKTHRAIAVEPVGNSVVQKGIDLELRSFLKHAGINLSNQDRNAYLAKKGSIDKTLCTIDLSSASDTISTAIVKRLLPWAWFCLLDETRSPAYKLGGALPVRYQKFASMGNGFCFPLESLIFASLIKAVIYYENLEPTFGVYGDDLIIDNAGYGPLKNVLSYCGFQLNAEKSFHEGNFRESCGADWYSGQDVRPVFLDYALTNVSELMIFHNSTLRSDRCRTFFREVRPWLRSQVRTPFLRPEEFRPNRPVDPLKGLGVWMVNKSHGTDVRIETEHFAQKLDKLLLSNANGAFSVPLSVFMGSSCGTWVADQQRWSWREYRFIPVPDDEQRTDLYYVARSIAKLQSFGAELNRRYTARRVTIKT